MLEVRAAEIANSIIPAAWNLVQRDLLIPFDWERTPLQIKTNSTNGGGEEIHVMMKTTNDDHIGAVALKFLTPQMRYKITKCTQNNGFVKITKQPPEEVNKTWTFRKTNISIIMECNGVVIKHFQFDDKQCVATWGRDVVKKVLFSGNLDSASLTYRAKPGKGN